MSIDLKQAWDFMQMGTTIDWEQGWGFLQKGITKLENILEGLPETQFSVDDYMMIHTTVYNMCTQKPPHDYSRLLYRKYLETFREYINLTVLPSLREKCGEFVLREFVKRWSTHKVMVSWLSFFFNYLDHCFVDQRMIPSLEDIGHRCFHNLVYREINGKVIDAVIFLINQEREGDRIDGALLRNVLDIFVEIGLGSMERYEAAVFRDTATYYSQKASNWILEDSCAEYMLKAEECLKHEKDRVSHYLHSSGEQKLLEIVQYQLLDIHASQLLKKEPSGVCALLRDGKVHDLSRMYRLFCRIPHGLDLVCQSFKQHITAEGTALVKQAEDAASNKKVEKKDVVGLQEQYFRRVIELHDKCVAYVRDCFQNHSVFYKALQEPFEDFCNKPIARSSSAELLAAFCDNILKKGGSEKLSDDGVEGMLDMVSNFLLTYLSDKDHFAGIYRRKLARRLLFDKSANDDHERIMLTKLKQQYGAPFTSKMEGMVTDIALVRGNQSAFEEYVNSNPQANPGIDLTVTVLNTLFWPKFKSVNLNLPAEMVKCIDVFEEFYQTQTKHRKLTWIYSLGTCNIIGKFERKTMELIVTTDQASALLLFNASDRLSYSEIKAQLNLLEDDVVIRLLGSLSCAKYKILNKEPNTKTISPTDYFMFNSKFTDKKTRIKIHPLPVDEKKKVEDFDKERMYAIDASIVRIMKRHEVLGVQQLVTKCVDQLKHMFKPGLKEVKKRIEVLIAREYLERDKDNPNSFRYLA